MQTLRVTSWVRLTLLGLGCSLPGCQWVFGDFEMVPAGAGAATATGGTGGGASTRCASGDAYRCNGNVVESCGQGSWLAVATCSSAELCDAKNGACLECVPGASRCTAFRLETCASSGSLWSVAEECATADYCDALSGSCVTCLTDEAFCSGASLYVCNTAHLGWTVTTCESADLCNARTRDCRPCTEGEYTCNDAVLQRCDAEQHWVTLDTCATSELCQDSLVEAAVSNATFSGQCAVPGCTAGVYRCNPSDKAELQGCPPSLRGWETLEDCGTSALCNASAGQCDAGCGTEPGSFRCLGPSLQRCRLDGTAWELIETCSSAAYCNATKQDCVPCVAGEMQCNGAVLQTCNANQTWTTGQTCLSAALCDAKNGECLDAGCPIAGAYQCVGTQLQQCASDYTGWVAVGTPCATVALCDAANGKCTPPECGKELPSSRCVSGAYQTCDATTRLWRAAVACDSNQVCTTGSGCLGSCPTPQWQCNSSSATSVTLEQCVVSGQSITWETRASCLSSALCANLLADCVDGGCSLTPTSCAPACSPQESQCSAAALMTCNEGLTGWNTETCGSAALCDAKAATCDVCVADQYSCSGATLQRCDSAGSGLLTTTLDCGTADACYVGTGATSGGCHTCATAGAARCSADGEALQVCVVTDGLRAWQSQVCPCSNGACVACNRDSDCGSQVCNTSTHTCVACLADGNCSGATRACDTSSSTCVGCTNDSYCSGATPACHLATQTCVGCTDAADCSDASTPVCDTTANQCVQCVAGTDCPGATPYCVSNACQGCRNSNDCRGPTPDCIAGTCQACNGAVGCSSGYTCDADSGLCVSVPLTDAGAGTSVPAGG